MKSSWTAILFASALMACTPVQPNYECVLGLCTDLSGHLVDPDVIDPETPAEIAAYPVYCHMTLDSDSDDVPSDKKDLIIRMWHEGPRPSDFAYGTRGSDSMAFYRRVALGTTVVFTEANESDLPPDVLTVYTDRPASFIAHTKHDYHLPARKNNIMIKTYSGSCTIKGTA